MMIHPVWKGIVLVVSTAVVAGAGGVLLMRLSGRNAVQQELDKMKTHDATPLHRRARYDRDDFVRYWNVLGSIKTISARHIEIRFLKLDLLYPFLYGGALLVALLLAWSANGKPFHLAWLLVPVIVMVAADWTENLVLLGQIRRFTAGGENAVQAGWITVASVATLLKMVFIAVCGGLLLWLAVWPFAPVPGAKLVAAVK